MRKTRWWRLALTGALVLAVALAAASCGGGGDSGGVTGYRVAVITGPAGITDQAQGQTVWEAASDFCRENGVEVKHYAATGDSARDQAAKVSQAAGDGCNIALLTGRSFAGFIAQYAGDYPDMKFVAIDMSEDDLLTAAVPLYHGTYDHRPDQWQLRYYVKLDNVYCAAYREELCGFMAGFAAVKLGCRDLGFLGSVELPWVVRYGYGFVQGADAAARDLDINVDMVYGYAGRDSGGSDIAGAVDEWYMDGADCVMVCGGTVYTSVADAAKLNAGARIIGTDTDAAGAIATYAAGSGADAALVRAYRAMTALSAAKNYGATVREVLADIILNDNWAARAGLTENLGITVGDDPSANYVRLSSVQYEDGKFTQFDYITLVHSLFDGSYTVISDTELRSPTELGCANVNVSYRGDVTDPSDDY